VELRFHFSFQPGRDHGLRDSVRHGGNAEDPDSRAMRFRYFHRHYRRREVAARGHPVPDLIKIILQVRFKVLDRLPVRSRRPAVGFHLQPGIPYLLFRYLKRLACRYLLAHSIPPGTFPVDLMREPRMSRPLRSAPTASSRGFTATTGRSACAPRIGTQPLAFQALGGLPLAALTGQAVPGRAFPRSAREPQTRLTPPPRRAPPGQ
jgi:hypothetical protein